MASERFKNLIRQQSKRMEALAKLQEIAEQFPDLFREAAEAFLEIPSPTKVMGTFVETLEKQPPTEAVIRWLQKNNRGTARDMIADLENRIATSSDKPAAIIHSTLSSLENRGKIKSIQPDQGEKVFVYLDPLGSKNVVLTPDSRENLVNMTGINE